MGLSPLTLKSYGPFLKMWAIGVMDGPEEKKNGISYTFLNNILVDYYFYNLNGSYMLQSFL